MHDPNEDLDESVALDDQDDADDYDDDEADDDYEEEEGDDEVAAATERPLATNDAEVGELVELVRFMVSALVDEPETLEIRPERFGQNVHIKIVVPEEDMGRVIGRQGRIARSMRTLLTIASSRKGLRASLDIDS
jgi:predicted RNA-binding protein YlqC (UPF0109 family)